MLESKWGSFTHLHCPLVWAQVYEPKCFALSLPYPHFISFFPPLHFYWLHWCHSLLSFALSFPFSFSLFSQYHRDLEMSLSLSASQDQAVILALFVFALNSPLSGWYDTSEGILSHILTICFFVAAIHQWPVQDVHHLLSNVCWDMLQPSAALNRTSSLGNGCLDRWMLPDQSVADVSFNNYKNSPTVYCQFIPLSGDGRKWLCISRIDIHDKMLPEIVK